jgi:serine/threonine protein kinase
LQRDGGYYEILPYYVNGDLERAAPLEAEFIINTVVPSINEGLKFLHDLGIIHRDIKPNNIFFSDDRRQVVIGDFGISSVTNQKISIRVTNGDRTIGYAAPETAQGFVMKESDYYSFGITLLHLVTGFDPFEGMTDTQILLQTINYPLNIPASVPSRLAELIRGLTVKDRNYRWGYAQVQRWCNQEVVPIYEGDTGNPARSNIKPYTFAGRKLYELEEFSLCLAENWTEGIKHLYRGYIADHLKQFGQELTSKGTDCAEERDQDLGFFKLIYLLNPKAPLCWRGEMFIDLYKLSTSISKELPQVNQSYLTLLTSGALQHFLQVKGFDSRFISLVQELEKQAVQDPDLAYYRLARLLGENPEFHYAGQTFSTPDDLVHYLYEQRSRLDQLAVELLANKDFLAWLYHLGYSEHIAQWQEIDYLQEGAG